MIFIIENTDIFDTNIKERFKRVLLDKIDKFTKDKIYILNVSFPVESTIDKKIEEFSLAGELKIHYKELDKKIYDVLSYQLEQIDKVLKENEIETYSTKIQGDKIEGNIIRVEIIEKGPKEEIKGKAKNKRPFKVNSIIPNLQFIEERISEVASKRLSEMFYDIMEKVNNNKKAMSYILKIKPTKDENKLFEVFIDKYGDLWLTTKEKGEELIDVLIEDIRLGIKKYFKDTGEKKYFKDTGEKKL